MILTSWGRPLLTHIVRTCFVLMVALAALLGVVPPTSSEELKGVNLTLSLDVRDPQAWFEAYQDILAAPSGSPEALVVTIVPRTPRRSIAIFEPKFSAAIGVGKPTQPIRVVVVGKMSGKVALATLQSFLYALYEPSPEPVPNSSGERSAANTVRLDYGLSRFTGDLVELRTDER